eukprot:3984501-Pleurochrysis_carterae.AAC.1
MRPGSKERMEMKGFKCMHANRYDCMQMYQGNGRHVHVCNTILMSSVMHIKTHALNCGCGQVLECECMHAFKCECMHAF